MYRPGNNFASWRFVTRSTNFQRLARFLNHFHEDSTTYKSSARNNTQRAFFSRSAARAELTACTNSCAAAEIFARLPSRKAAASIRSAPTPRANAPAAMNSAAFAAFTPPVGIKSAFGKGAFSDFKYLGPPTLPQGKILTSRAP